MVGDTNVHPDLLAGRHYHNGGGVPLMKLIFDIETNGLLDSLTEIHCISMIDLDNPDKVIMWGPDNVGDGVEYMSKAKELIGHNIIRFDIPAIKKVYPWFDFKGKLTDTLVLSRVIWPDIRERDLILRKRDPEFPGKFLGSHNLGSWGYRLGVAKSDYEGTWEEWNQEMHDYCEQDARVTLALYQKTQEKKLDPRCHYLEHEVAKILQEQEAYGFAFDVDAASDLYGRLCGRRDELSRDLADLFPDWEVRTPFVPKSNNKKLGYEKGVPTEKVKVMQFNPNSRDHISNRLIEKYGWEPTEFTPEGKPRVDEIVLGRLDYPEAKLLAESFMLTKRLGQLSEGQNGWLKLEQDGVIYGSVNTNGAVTGRMTHARPNMAQVPSTRALYGTECRQLFVARPGHLLVGCDADALELRCLASYMAHFDQGEYVDVVLNGEKASGTDTHSRNAKALGCDRDTAKTWFYAFIYGAGNKKLGAILGGSARKGKEAKERFFENLPALGKLVETVQHAAASRGYLIGLDGRHLPIRSYHAALNTLLQSAGAVIMKQALVILDGDFKAYNLPAHFVANVHDEWQIEVKEGYEDEVGRRAVDAIRAAGGELKLKCPMDAQYVVGKNWAETH